MRVGGIELGGTKSIAVLAEGRDILAKTSIPTGDDPGRTVAALVNWLTSEASGSNLGAIGIALGPTGR